jgi:fucose permease
MPAMLQQDEATRTRNRARLLRPQIGLSFYAFVLIGATEEGLGVLIPSLEKHYGIDKSTVSLLFLAATSGYMIAALVSGLLTHKLGVRLFLTWGVVAFLLGVLSFVLMLPFGVVLAFLLFLGFGVAIIDAGLNSYVAHLPRNEALLNYLHAFYGVGAFIGPLVGTFALAAHFGWNSVYVVWLVMGLLLLVGFFLVFEGREPPQPHEAAETNENLLVAVLKRREVLFGALFLLLYVGSEVSLGNWAYSFLTEERREEQVFSGLVVSGYWLGLTLGRFLLARVVARVGSRRMIELCLGGVAAGLLLTWAGHGALAAAGLWLAGFAFGPIYPTTIALMSQIVPGRLLPSAVGVLASAGSVGAAVFAWQAGNLAQAFGLWTLMPLEIAITVAMLGAWAALVSSKREGGIGSGSGTRDR